MVPLPYAWAVRIVSFDAIVMSVQLAVVRRLVAVVGAGVGGVGRRTCCYSSRMVEIATTVAVHGVGYDVVRCC